MLALLFYFNNLNIFSGTIIFLLFIIGVLNLNKSGKSNVLKGNTMNDLTENSVKIIINSEQYLELEKKERNSLEKKLTEHFQMLIIESFINRLSSEEAEKITEITKRESEETSKIINQALQKPEFLKDVKARLKREIEVFKSLKK